jgi:hypothetical protein
MCNKTRRTFQSGLGRSKLQSKIAGGTGQLAQFRWGKFGAEYSLKQRQGVDQ